MASYVYKDLKIYKDHTSGNAIGVVKGDKIYKGYHTSGNAVGVVKGDKIYKGYHTSSNPIGSVANIKREIKDSNSVDGATIVAAYHFLIKNIF